MTAPRDKFGRPIVVVTGMGIVTSLGAGKTDNWAKLSAGCSGIRTVTRFPIDGLKTTMAGTVDFLDVEPFSSTGLTERLAELARSDQIRGVSALVARDGTRVSRRRRADASRARASGRGGGRGLVRRASRTAIQANQRREGP